MLKKIEFCIFLILLSYIAIFSQEFQITTTGYNFWPVVDPFTKDIYYYDDLTSNVMKIRVNGSNNMGTHFPLLPIFSSLVHKAYYCKIISSNPHISKLIEYSFSTGDTSILAEFGSMVTLSPTQQKLLFNDPTNAPMYYSLIENTVYDPGIRLNAEKIEWMNDTTLIYLDSYSQRICKYSYGTNSIDTLVTTTLVAGIGDFACNQDSNIIAYSHFFNNNIDVGVNLYRLSSQMDIMIFNFNEDDPQLSGLPVILEELEWSLTSKILAFIGNGGTVNLAELYVYNLNEDTTIRLTDFINTDDGRKRNLIWFNEDTLIYDCYKSSNPGLQIFGFQINKPSLIRTNPVLQGNNNVLTEAFPNPFNNSIHLQFLIPFPGDVTIFFYNSIGELVDRISLGHFKKGTNSYLWIPDDQNFSSGIYFSLIHLNTGKRIYYSNVNKLIYIK